MFELPVANYQILTRYKLCKRLHIEDLTCLFCGEMENVHHLAFDCIVARVTWKCMSGTSNFT